MVKAVHLSHQRLLIATEENVYVHELRAHTNQNHGNNVDSSNGSSNTGTASVSVRLLDTIPTENNPRGLCTLAPTMALSAFTDDYLLTNITNTNDNNSNNMQAPCYAAIAGVDAAGSVLLYDTTAAHSVAKLQAHETPIAALTFSEDSRYNFMRVPLYLACLA